MKSRETEFLLKFCVGRDAPIYRFAIRETQKALPASNPFRGALGLELRKQERFPESLEATVLLTLLARSTRAIAEQIRKWFFDPIRSLSKSRRLSISAAGNSRGCRSKGRWEVYFNSSLRQMLRASEKVVVVIDAQSYATVSREDMGKEILQDVVDGILASSAKLAKELDRSVDLTDLERIRSELSSGILKPEESVPKIKRSVKQITASLQTDIFVFFGRLSRCAVGGPASAAASCARCSEGRQRMAKSRRIAFAAKLLLFCLARRASNSGRCATYLARFDLGKSSSRRVPFASNPGGFSQGGWLFHNCSGHSGACFSKTCLGQCRCSKRFSSNVC